jgi:hypothetical protein
MVGPRHESLIVAMGGVKLNRNGAAILRIYEDMGHSNAGHLRGTEQGVKRKGPLNGKRSSG